MKTAKQLEFKKLLIECKHEKQLEEYFRDYKKSREVLSDDRRMLEEYKLSAEGQHKWRLDDKMERDQKAWKNEWSLKGRRYTELKTAQEKEINEIVEAIRFEKLAQEQIKEYVDFHYGPDYNKKMMRKQNTERER